MALKKTGRHKRGSVSGKKRGPRKTKGPGNPKGKTTKWNQQKTTAQRGTTDNMRSATRQKRNEGI